MTTCTSAAETMSAEPMLHQPRCVCMVIGAYTRGNGACRLRFADSAPPSEAAAAETGGWAAAAAREARGWAETGREAKGWVTAAKED